MKRVSELTPAERGRLRGLLFDLDDTLLDHGRLRPEALAALYDLSAAGLSLVGVTGRPASWGQVLARQWPVAAMVTENGIISLIPSGRGVTLFDRLGPQERQARRSALRAIAEQVQHHYPELIPTDDNVGRFADFTFDIGETRDVPDATVQRAARLARDLGARTVRSSVHLHLALDVDDKATGSLRLLQQLFGIAPGAARFEFAFIGDSENDAACFAGYHTSIGVANLRGAFSVPPRYRTLGARSVGFIEAAEALLGGRKG
jgi:HAD superfamily hydrolase (TIGR01484 family)